MNPIRVLLVDDHPVVREGLRMMLRDEPGIEVQGEAASGEEAVVKVEELKPDVILMDIRMPDVDGMETTRRIKKLYPLISVIMLTMYDNDLYVIEGVRAGAAGYLTKDCSRELLCHTIRTVTEGGTLLPSRLLHHVIHDFLSRPGKGALEDAGVSPGLFDRLTPRELEILGLLTQSYSNKEICRQLYLAEVTVKKHIQSITSKMGVSDRTQAAILAVRMGLAG